MNNTARRNRKSAAALVMVHPRHLTAKDAAKIPAAAFSTAGTIISQGSGRTAVQLPNGDIYWTPTAALMVA